MSDRKVEARAVGEKLLELRKAKIVKELQARGVSAPGYETATVAEVRSAGGVEHRVLSSVRASGSNMRTLTGRAVVYNSRSADLGQFREIISPGAFRSSLGRRDDVMCLRDHNPELLLGRTSSGTLGLDDGGNGLDFTCDLPDTVVGRDVQTMVARGDLSKCSFGFVCEDDDWDYDDDDFPLRTVRAASIFDVSVVANPAYPSTSCGLRSTPEAGNSYVGSDAQRREREAMQAIVRYRQSGRPVPSGVHVKLMRARMDQR